MITPSFLDHPDAAARRKMQPSQTGTVPQSTVSSDSAADTCERNGDLCSDNPEDQSEPGSE